RDQDLLRRAGRQTQGFGAGDRRVGWASFVASWPEAEGERIVEAVELTLELEYERSSGCRPSDPNRVGGCLGSRGREAYHLKRGNARDEALGQLDLGWPVVGAGKSPIDRLS